ncbi:hypothetical protein JI739_05165 [Ramlibacter sp. AW1]|uniref:DUF4258 domain-containing protein n=1 Tax=Ramlibacter aurantiacus TaxID=2801330 RepID=A0A937D2G9_9BURK|nr:hypothetical protein [Ramlibacter aurantiacus]MBL0419735.1 hypothetical protein [Ramlibacter aurantiacus]
MPSASNAQYDPLARRKIELSRHASKRASQRAITQDCVPLILAYGERSHDGRGGVRYLLTQRSMASLGRAIGHSQRLEALAGCYAVVDAANEQTVITLGHRYQ